MAKKYIVANWKSHHTIVQTRAWLEQFDSGSKQNAENEGKVVIVCPSFPALSEMKRVRDEKSLPFYMGVQNISPFEEGAYTGEVASSQAKELADYVIIGHSERREHFGETDELLEKKVQLAKAVGFGIIFCIQGKDTRIPDGVDIVAYEPVFAIGSGTPDTPENAEEVASYLKQDRGVSVVLYGGSVTQENIHTFTNQSSIDGALIGGASLSAESFLSLIRNA